MPARRLSWARIRVASYQTGFFEERIISTSIIGATKLFNLPLIPTLTHTGKNHAKRSIHVRSQDNPKGNNDRYWRKFAIAVTLSSVGYWTWKKYNFDDGVTVHLESKTPEKVSGSYDVVQKNLPFYSRNDVGKHYEASTRIWVSFRRGVYDVTEFVDKHPGGSKILMAAGGSLEPFWELYPVHQNQHVFSILEKYRIGNLREEDVLKSHEAVDHFQGEPERHPVLIKRSGKPFNGETPPTLLTEKFYTPNEVFYVRNHLPVPSIDLKTYELEVEGINIKDKSFSLNDLKKFPKATISATIQCGGNRRTEMGKAKPVAGLAWTGGAIGNAKWSGARLIDVLRAANFNPDSYENPEKLHIKFDGLDMDQSGECYGASIPLSYILDRNFDAILAYEMNDKPIPMDHGFPVRIVLPGIVGARSVKWLGKISISDEESQSPWQQRDYKVFSPQVTLETVDFSAAPAIMDTPVTSYICSHEDGEIVKAGKLIKLQGYAFSGGGRKIVRVEISSDKGKTWQVAKISDEELKFNRTKNWSWTLWELEINLQKDTEIWVKAVDSGYNQQPESFENIWNYRGLMSTAYHKINLKVK